MHSSSMNRRGFLGAAAAITATFAAMSRVRAYGHDGDLGHPVPPPPSLDFQVMSFDTTPLKGGPSTAIIGMPKGLAPGEKVPLVVLLPGGHSNWQPHDAGCWCWWSEYDLGYCETALRRGVLEAKDFQDLVRPEELTRFNENLAKTPYRGVAVAAAWCLTRDYVLEPNGKMNSDWLRMLVERCRKELPVLQTREGTGLGGMSSGALWAMYCGAQCEDVFGHVNATQPYTRELVQVLRRAVEARKTDQKLRIVGALDDRIRIPTSELVALLKADGVDVPYYEYLGKHDQKFAAGPGGLDMLFHFDRVLRGQRDDGSYLVPPPVPPLAGVGFTGTRGVRLPSSGQGMMGRIRARTAAVGALALGGAAAAALLLRRARGDATRRARSSG
jgi:hypothetical protein